MLRSEHTQLQSFRERFPAAFKQGQMMCCGYFLQHEAEFAAFWGGAGNRCDPPTCQRPPPTLPLTHTHSNSFQHVEEEFCSSVLSHDQFSIEAHLTEQERPFLSRL